MGRDANYFIEEKGFVMKKEAFFEEIADIFEIEEEVNKDTPIGIDSLAMLSLIALYDENFDMQITGMEIGEVSKVSDLMRIAGMDKFE
jgi:acyl carrier protein